MTVPEPAPSLDRGTYEIVRDRLLAQARTLGDKTERLNARRLELFGGSELTVLGSERIRTENNCVPRDIVAVGDLLLFGYNVFFGLKSATTVADVLSLHTFSKVEEEGGRTVFAFNPVPPDAPGYFLNDPRFVREFQELYQYYKGTRLLQLRRPEGKLLAVFQTGAALTDIKVFRWAVDPEGRATYVDNRGERDHVFPPSHDFAWTATTRDDHRRGRHPHVSILDTVFVETIGGDLTVKVEDNTESGQGVYREPVEDPDQSLDDAEVHYAKLGSLILLKVLPYREKAYRYLVFNTLTRQVDRIDALGQACVQLPEDHGLIFPGGYYLRSGETKVFDLPSEGMEYKRVWRSPNGEDVLYVFHKRDEGMSVLLPYNLIRRQVQNPILCHGYSLFEDGTMVVFRAGSSEPTRVHTMQIWQTPFATHEHAARARSTGDYFERIGNAELVRGVSDLLSLRRSIEEQRPSEQVYEDLIAAANRAIDTYHWLGREEVGNLQADLKEILATCEVIVGEFEKVESLRKAAAESVAAAERDLEQLAGTLRTAETAEWQSVDRYVEALSALRTARGRIISLREQRYADLPRLDALEKRAVERFEAVAAAAVELLQGPQSLAPYHEQLAAHEQEVETVTTVAAAAPLGEKVEALGTSLELLAEVVGALPIADATVRTAILEALSEVLARLNRVRALLAAHRQGLLEKEGTAEFGAQIRLFGQAVAGALALADTPERADAQLSKLMLQLEELESRFSELDTFVGQLADKREEVVEAFAARKQALMDARQRRARNLEQAAARILEGIRRRSGTFASDDEVNAFFASDPMAAKARDLVAKLRELGDVVRADEIEGRIKSTRLEAARALRDRRDLFEEGTSVLKLGRHRFSVNTQPLELAVVPRGHAGDAREETGMVFHLTGTDFYEPVADPEFLTTRPFWEQTLISETAEVYRAEYLAFLILADAEAGRGGLSLHGLRQGKLDEIARTYAAERYDEGYERGLHDHDAALILERLLALHGGAGLLRFGPRPRAFAALFWALFRDDARRAAWSLRAASLARLRSTFAPTSETAALAQELAGAVETFLKEVGIPVEALGEGGLAQAGAYLAEEIAGQPVEFTTSAEAESLRKGFLARLESTGTARAFADDLRGLEADPGSAYRLTRSWLDAHLTTLGEAGAAQRAVLEETAVLLLTERKLSRRLSHAATAGRVEGLLGQHPRIEQRAMTLQLDEFLARLEAFRRHRVPAFRDYLARRHRLILDERRRLRLDEFLPKVMSAFVRNKLIDQVYLPLIGDNLAKQLGTVGEGRRTDQMGLLLLLSPPGYGKTTLMEYVANRLGLIFMKVNGPALGHGVKSLDPAEAPNATSRQEVEKINLALEMGNNVLLYLDDIQHTHSELLQKFISLCDAQRKIEGVWRGETRTYDLRGKRFCVCMAGNPYTESGERFRIPDMLANRADTFNLGDVLAGKEDLFALSYVENALTSNPALAPLAGRDLEDVHKLVRLARGEEVSADQLAHPYTALELGEITGVLRRLLRVQDVLLRVNREYVRSASMEDAFRTEPRFQLQGSYRNMNKLAARIVPVMNDAELEAVVDDHYAAEAQTLTQGAEHNLLKLAEIRGRQSPEQAARWEEIKKSFRRVQLLGAADGDPVARVTGQLSLLSERMDEIGDHIAAAGKAVATGFGKSDGFAEALTPFVEALHGNLEALAKAEAKRRSEPESPAPLPVLVAPSNGNGGPDGFAPYLEKLEQTLAALADVSATPRGTEVVQSLAPGVHDLLTELVDAVGETLIPLLRGIGRRLKAEVKADPQWGELLDRTFKNLDQLRDLAEALRKIEVRGARFPLTEPRKDSKDSKDSKDA